jgi:hypothetical protein
LLQASSVDVARTMGLSSFEIEMLRFYESLKKELWHGNSEHYDSLFARCVEYRYPDYIMEMLGILLCDDFRDCESIVQRATIYRLLGDLGVHHGRLTAAKCVTLLCEYAEKEFDARPFGQLINALRLIGGKYGIQEIDDLCEKHAHPSSFYLYYDGVRHDLTQAIFANYSL